MAEEPEGQRSPPDASPKEHGARRLFWLFVAIYLLTLRGHLGSRDEESLYMTSVMGVKQVEESLGIAWTLPEPSDAREPLFASYEPGQPLLAIPFYLGGSALASLFPVEARTYVSRLVVTLFGVLVTAGTVARLYQFGRFVGYGSRAATLTAVAYGLGTLAWPYSRTFFREPLVGLALLSAVLALGRWRQTAARADLLSGWAWLLLAVATKLTALLAVPALALYLLMSGRRRATARDALAATGATRRARLALVGPGVLFFVVAGLVVGARWADFGVRLDTILDGLQNQAGMDNAGLALYGLTLSPGKGLLIFAPPVLAGLAGLPLLARRRPAEAVLCVALPGLYLTAYSLDPNWHGGACWGPRYLLPVVPLLVLPLGELASRLWEVRERAIGQAGLGLLGLLLLAGGVVQLAGISIDPIHYYLDVWSRHTLTLDAGPGYLREINFDPALSPIPGHLALASRYVADLAAGRVTFPAVPYQPLDYWQYFQYLPSLDLALVHWLGWWQSSGSPDYGEPGRSRIDISLAPSRSRIV